MDDTFAMIVRRQYGSEFHLGVTISLHRHAERPLHFHLLVDAGWWFIEWRVGRDQFKLDDEVVR